MRSEYLLGRKSRRRRKHILQNRSRRHLRHLRLLPSNPPGSRPASRANRRSDVCSGRVGEWIRSPCVVPTWQWGEEERCSGFLQGERLAAVDFAQGECLVGGGEGEVSQCWEMGDFGVVLGWKGEYIIWHWRKLSILRLSNRLPSSVLRKEPNSPCPAKFIPGEFHTSNTKETFIWQVQDCTTELMPKTPPFLTSSLRLRRSLQTWTPNTRLSSTKVRLALISIFILPCTTAGWVRGLILMMLRIRRSMIGG